jgi:hypothetical protein
MMPAYDSMEANASSTGQHLLGMTSPLAYTLQGLTGGASTVRPAGCTLAPTFDCSKFARASMLAELRTRQVENVSSCCCNRSAVASTPFGQHENNVWFTDHGDNCDHKATVML